MEQADAASLKGVWLVSSMETFEGLTDISCWQRHLQAAYEVRRVLHGTRRQRAARGAQHDDAGAAGAAEVALSRYEERVHHACNSSSEDMGASKAKNTLEEFSADATLHRRPRAAMLEEEAAALHCVCGLPPRNLPEH